MNAANWFDVADHALMLAFLFGMIWLLLKAGV